VPIEARALQGLADCFPQLRWGHGHIVRKLLLTMHARRRLLKWLMFGLWK
jgi:hypothetical protein